MSLKKIFFSFLVLPFLSFRPTLASDRSEDSPSEGKKKKVMTLSRTVTWNSLICEVDKDGPFVSGQYRPKQCKMRYAQKLWSASEGTSGYLPFPMRRKKTKTFIQYVGSFSKNHLVAQGVCEFAGTILSQPLRLGLFKDFFQGSSPQGSSAEDENKIVDWVSYEAESTSSSDYFIRKKTNHSHSESLLILDLEAVFKKNPEAVVDLFVPDQEHEGQDIFMCGLEIFSTHDVCDLRSHGKSFIGCEGCIAALCEFRKDNVTGQKSIAGAILERLRKDGFRFRGRNKMHQDAFVLIYHSAKPYAPIQSYEVDNEGRPLHLKYAYESGFSLSEPNHQDTLNTSTFSQASALALDDSFIFDNPVEGDESANRSVTLFGYIHEMGDQEIEIVKK